MARSTFLITALFVSLCLLEAALANYHFDYSRSSRVRRQSGNCNMADIIFVLDSSGSIKPENWPKALDFVNRVVKNFPNVGPSGAQFGSVTYGNQASVDFYLNDYSDQNSIMNKVNNIRYKDENTNTSGALWVMKDLMFVSSKGDRPQAPNICIVVTDGESTYDKEKTIPYANEAKSKGIVMIVIGVGNAVNKDELNGIASTINGTRHVYTVENYDSLGAIQGEIAKAACDVRADCLHVADITFVLDASSNVKEADFNATKQFLKSVIDNLNVADGESNIAVVAYSDSARIVFNLNENHGRAKIKEAIDKTPYLKGSSNLAEALRLTRESIYTKRDGDRPDKTNIAVVITNRGSNNPMSTIEQAKLARGAGVNIISIGIKSWLNEAELLEITSDPDSANCRLLNNYGELGGEVSKVHGLLCDGALFACYTNPCQNGGTCFAYINHFYCSCPTGFAGTLCQYRSCQPSDVTFILDSSGTPGPDNFYRYAVNFTKAVATTLNLDPSSSKMAFESFSDSAKVEFYLGTYSSRPETVAAISPQYVAGPRVTHQALAQMTNDIMTAGRGARSGDTRVKGYGVLLTYGKSTDLERTRLESARAHESEITMLAVAVNTRAEDTLQELRGIASDPNSANLAVVNSYTELSNPALLDKIGNAICNGVNECDSNPCQAGGTCTDGVNGYTCRCPPERIGVNCEKTCLAQMDIVIAVDSSGSIRENRFPMVINYVKTVVNNFDISDDRVRIGVLTFADNPTIRFNLNSFKKKEDVLQAIDVLQYTRGMTNIAAAITTARTMMFTSNNGDRSNVPNFLWIFTDGEPTLAQLETIPAAVDAKNAGIHIQAVVMAADTPRLLMKNIVTQIWENNYFAMSSYNQLATNFPARLLCDDVNECNSGPCRNGGQCVNGMGRFYCVCNDVWSGITCELQCSQSVDLVFILDASGSTEDSFENAQKLVRGVVQNLNFANDRTRVGIMLYSDNPRVIFQLNERSSSRQNILESVAFTLSGGKTNTAAALDQARNDMFTSGRGRRNGVRGVAVVVTDGMSNINQQDTIPAAQRLQQSGVTVIGVGLRDSEGLNMGEVRGISTPAGNNNYPFAFEISDPAPQLSSVATSISNIICQNIQASTLV